MLKKADTIPLPTSLEEVNDLLAKIRDMQRAIATVNTERDAVIQRLETEFAPLRIAHDEAVKTEQDTAQKKREAFEIALEGYQDVLHTYAKNNRTSLLTGKSKTVLFSNGQLSWKLDSGISVVVEADEEENVIRRIKRKGKEWADKFLRIRVELNRRTLGSEQPTIKGITYEQKEFFIIQTASDIPGGQEVFEPIKMSA